MSNLITLSEWAKKNGIDPSTARHSVLRGKLKTAVKMGRDWFIDANEPNTDRRFKKNKKNEQDNEKKNTEE